MTKGKVKYGVGGVPYYKTDVVEAKEENGVLSEILNENPNAVEIDDDTIEEKTKEIKKGKKNEKFSRIR